MGVDAVMVLRTPDPVALNQLLQLSCDLAEAFGSEYITTAELPIMGKTNQAASAPRPVLLNCIVDARMVMPPVIG